MNPVDALTVARKALFTHGEIQLRKDRMVAIDAADPIAELYADAYNALADLQYELIDGKEARNTLR